MSYSFSVSGASKPEVKKKLAEAFDSVVTNQPPHAFDREAAVAAGSAFVDMLMEPAEGEEVHLSMHGSLGWNSLNPDKFTGAGVGVSAVIRPRQG